MVTCSAEAIRIVLVDDHPMVLWGIEKLIRSAEPRMQVVATATCRAELLRAIEEYSPDIVLLDLDLGEENGLDLISEARERGPKVVILTGLQDAGVKHRAIMAGAVGFIGKTESADLILRAIERVQEGEVWLDRDTTAKVFSSFWTEGNKPIAEGNRRHHSLTPTERKIVAAVTKNKGHPNKIIAAALHISSHTLRNHLASIYQKLGLHRRIDLVFYAMENGLDMEARPDRSISLKRLHGLRESFRQTTW
jgi:two-component system, NarL family, nitrate/nitrite response regulator NarL